MFATFSKLVGQSAVSLKHKFSNSKNLQENFEECEARILAQSEEVQ